MIIYVIRYHSFVSLIGTTYINLFLSGEECSRIQDRKLVSLNFLWSMGLRNMRERNLSGARVRQSLILPSYSLGKRKHCHLYRLRSSKKQYIICFSIKMFTMLSVFNNRSQEINLHWTIKTNLPFQKPTFSWIKMMIKVDSKSLKVSVR